MEVFFFCLMKKTSRYIIKSLLFFFTCNFYSKIRAIYIYISHIILADGNPYC